MLYHSRDAIVLQTGFEKVTFGSCKRKWSPATWPLLKRNLRVSHYGFTLFRLRTAGAPAEHYRWLQRRIRTQLQAGADQTSCTRTANTCRNLLALWAALWHFLDDSTVPPTNNAAERALRGFVIRRKLSYFTRSGRGLRFIEHTFSAVQTCRLQGRNVFDYMVRPEIFNLPPPAACLTTRPHCR